MSMGSNGSEEQSSSHGRYLEEQFERISKIMQEGMGHHKEPLFPKQERDQNIANIRQQISSKLIEKYLTPNDDQAITFFDGQNLSEQEIKMFSQNQMLTAKAFQIIRHISIEETQIQRILQKQSLEFSCDKKLWERKQEKQRYYFRFQDEDKKGKQKNIPINYEEMEKKSKMLKIIHNFMRKINVLESQKIHVLESQNKEESMVPETHENLFAQKIQKIAKKEYKITYMLNKICQYSKYEKTIENILFYLGDKRVRANRTIQTLHSKAGNYEFLEDVHDYVQWMFPNHYGSSFNSQAQPLSYSESDYFQRSFIIGLNLLKSTYIFFDFMGISISSEDGRLALLSRKRLINVIVRYGHNHLRIMRILACLSVTGFRKIALNLIAFLKHAVTVDKELSREFSTFEKQWKIYGDTNKTKAKQMCFLQTEDFPKDHFIISLYFKKKQITLQDNDVSFIVESENPDMKFNNKMQYKPKRQVQVQHQYKPKRQIQHQKQLGRNAEIILKTKQQEMQEEKEEENLYVANEPHEPNETKNTKQYLNQPNNSLNSNLESSSLTLLSQSIDILQTGEHNQFIDNQIKQKKQEKMPQKQKEMQQNLKEAQEKQKVRKLMNQRDIKVEGHQANNACC